MDKIKKLEINRLIRELEFVQSDFEYKSELINRADTEFIQSVGDFISGYPDLKKIYDDRFKESISHKVEDLIVEEVEYSDLGESESIDPKVKDIYRNIVKKTHPDKINDYNLNTLYVESTKHYQEGDILALYRICDIIGVEYEFGEEDFLLLNHRLQIVKDRIKFMETTFTWKWLNTDDQKKKEIVFDFVRLQFV